MNFNWISILLLSSSVLEVKLGSVCQDMWNKATNNLKISPSELTVNPVKDSPAVFQLNPNETKTKTAEFVSFKGNTTTTKKHNFLNIQWTLQ